MHEYQNIDNDDDFSFKLFKKYCKNNKPTIHNIADYLIIRYPHFIYNNFNNKPLPERFLIYILKNYYPKNNFTSYKDFYKYLDIPSHIRKLLNENWS